MSTAGGPTGGEPGLARVNRRPGRAVVRAGMRIALLEAVERDARAGFERVLAMALSRDGP